jgi:hypothetical protein
VIDMPWAGDAPALRTKGEHKGGDRAKSEQHDEEGYERVPRDDLAHR